MTARAATFPAIERLSEAATRALHERWAAIDQDLLRLKAAHARGNPRRREVHCLHAGDEDRPQRMLNALQPGSYIPPHRHPGAGGAETILLLTGSLAFVVFGPDGSWTRSDLLHLSRRSQVVGADCRAGVWHTSIALEPDTVVFEVKAGPYRPATDKQAAPWAPAEDSAEGSRYLARLEDAVRHQLLLPPRTWSL